MSLEHLIEPWHFKKEDFGSEFVFGVATAAAQIEGAYDVEGKSPSVWDVFCKKKERKFKGESNKVSCDFYHRYKEDIALLNELNFKHFRFSVAWSRVKPGGKGAINHKGADFYKRILDELESYGISPWVTCYHWDLPQILEKAGGWTNRDSIAWFEEYVYDLAKLYGDRVKNWMVMNEPMVFTGAGYFLGYHAPGRKGFGNFLSASHHAAMSMGAGGRVLKNEVKDSMVGTTFSGSWVEPFSLTERDIIAAKKMDAILNRWYLEPILGKPYPYELIPKLQEIEKYIKPDDYSLLPFNFDFLGLQVYTREVAKYSIYAPYLKAGLVSAKERGLKHTLMGWEIYPQSLRYMLKKYTDYPNMPTIYVTENGAAFEDYLIDGEILDFDRASYIHQHLAEVLESKKQGIDVRGYFAWTFTDNFEWAELYRPRFGLVHVDFETQQRTVKLSGRKLQEFLS